MKKRGNRSQTFTEYVILVAIVAAVLVGMRIYMERAMQQKFRESADVFGEGEQYAKGVTQATYNDEPGFPPPPIDPPKDICPGLLDKIKALEDEIRELNDRIASFEQSVLDLNNTIAELNAQIPILREQARQLRIQADDYEAQADAKDAAALAKRNEAKDFNAQADKKRDELDALKRANPSCYSGCGCVTGSEPSCQTMNEIAALEKERDSLRSQAAEKKAQADDKQEDIDFYKKNFPQCFTEPPEPCPGVKEAIAALEGEIKLLHNEETELNAQANKKEKEANDKKATIPACYSGSGCLTTCDEGDNCCCVFDTVAKLELEIADLRGKAALSNAAAAVLESEAKNLHEKAASLYKAADDADAAADDLRDTQIISLEGQVEKFEEEINRARNDVQKKEQQIEDFKKNYPYCF